MSWKGWGGNSTPVWEISYDISKTDVETLPENSDWTVFWVVNIQTDEHEMTLWNEYTQGQMNMYSWWREAYHKAVFLFFLPTHELEIFFVASFAY